MDILTGVVSLKTLGELDHDKATSYQVTVSAFTSIASGTTQQTFTIQIIKDNTDTDSDGTRDHIDDDKNDPCKPSDTVAACDTDGDGTPDGTEGNTDTDGDGTPDKEESSTKDTDGDGVVDQLDDDNTNPLIMTV